MNGFLNLYKPAGVTSSACVQRVRRLLRVKKCGHGGTLDPSAVGVLPIAIGRCTKLFNYLDRTKVYVTDIQYGKTTNTDDSDGILLKQTPAPWLTRKAVEGVLQENFQGDIMQFPPMVSARKVKGKRLYEVARSLRPGEEVPREATPTRIDRIELERWSAGDYPTARVLVECSTGTYMRSIARDSGQMLFNPDGSGEAAGGHCTYIERLQSGYFTSDASMTFEELLERVETKTLKLIPPDYPIFHMPAICLSREIAIHWCNGNECRFDLDLLQYPGNLKLSAEKIHGQPVRVYTLAHDGENDFLGIAWIDKVNIDLSSAILHHKCVFTQANQLF